MTDLTKLAEKLLFGTETRVEEIPESANPKSDGGESEKSVAISDRADSPSVAPTSHYDRIHAEYDAALLGLKSKKRSYLGDGADRAFFYAGYIGKLMIQLNDALEMRDTLCENQKTLEEKIRELETQHVDYRERLCE